MVQALKGVSSEQAAAEGPQSIDVDPVRLEKCCAAALLSGIEAAERIAFEKFEPQKPDDQPPPPKPQNVHLTWSCVGRFDAEKFIRTRNIRLYHSPYKNCKSVLIQGGQVHRFTKKNKNRPAVDDIVSPKMFKHESLEVVAKRTQAFIDEYPLILCDNRCVNELPLLVKKRIACKIDCTDPKSFIRKLEWGVKSSAIRTGKGTLSFKVGTTRLTPEELLENVRFSLRFFEDHLPEIWENVKVVSIRAGNEHPLKLLDRTSADDAGAPAGDGAKRARGSNNDDDDDDEVQPPVDDGDAHDRGVDIFAQPRRKRVKRA